MVEMILNKNKIINVKKYKSYEFTNVHDRLVVYKLYIRRLQLSNNQELPEIWIMNYKSKVKLRRLSGIVR